MKFDVIVCDDIRQEANGKLIFVGVYPTDLVPAQVPSVITLTVWIRIHDYGALPRFVYLRLVPPTGGQELSIEIPITAGRVEGGPLIVQAVGLPVEVKGYGDLKAFVRLDGREEVMAHALPISQRRG